MTSHSGAFAEFMIAPANATFRIPEGMPYRDAAAFQLIYQTSYFALVHRANLKRDEYLLVHGGAGGVGTAAIQIGKALGAKVIATAGSADKLQICRQCGAEFVIDYHSENFVDKVNEITEGKGADLIYDPVGGDVFDQSTKCIAWAEGTQCLVCEEHCPISNKAIKIVKGKVGKPVVDKELCIGCGICQFKCPVRLERAIKVYEAGSVRT